MRDSFENQEVHFILYNIFKGYCIVIKYLFHTNILTCLTRDLKYLNKKIGRKKWIIYILFHWKGKKSSKIIIYWYGKSMLKWHIVISQIYLMIKKLKENTLQLYTFNKCLHSKHFHDLEPRSKRPHCKEYRNPTLILCLKCFPLIHLLRIKKRFK